MSATTITPTTLPAGSWSVDTLHSSIGFAVRHNLISTFRGRFEDYNARLVVDGEGHAELNGTVNATSVSVRDEALAIHLAAPDFFDTARHPELRFHSTAIRREGERAEVDGELEIKGRKRKLSAAGTVSDTVEDPFSGTRLAIEVQATIDRRDYGLDWNMPMPRDGLYLSNEVTLTITLEFNKTA